VGTGMAARGDDLLDGRQKKTSYGERSMRPCHKPPFLRAHQGEPGSVVADLNLKVMVC